MVRSSMCFSNTSIVLSFPEYYVIKLVIIYSLVYCIAELTRNVEVQEKTEQEKKQDNPIPQGWYFLMLGDYQAH